MRHSAAFFLILISATAHAQATRIEGVESQPVTVVGMSSYAHDCQLAAEAAGRAADGIRHDLAACDLAINRAGMSSEDRASTYLHRGIINTAIGQLDEAQADYLRAEALDSGNAALYLSMGNLSLLMQDLNGALMQYDRAEQLGLAETHVIAANRGMVLFLLGRQEEGEAEYAKALDIMPEWKTALDQREVLRSWSN